MKDAKNPTPPADDPESLEPAALLGEPLDVEPPTGPGYDESTDIADVPEHDLAGALAAQLIVTARNNPNPPTQADYGKVQVVTELALELGQAIFFLCPDTRDRSLALTALEDVVTRASKSIYVKDPVGGTRAPALVDQAQERLRSEAAHAESQDER